MPPFGNIVDTATSLIDSSIPGASLVLPDVPWYRTWWGIGLLGAGGIVTVAFLFHRRRPTYVIVNRPLHGPGSTKTASQKYKRAKPIVDGRVVREEIPNRASIGAELTHYEVLPGVREIPFEAFDQMGPLRYYSTSEERITKNLATRIRESKEINPLIVVEDSEGPYILEGGHRFDALRELGAKSFPALVVVEQDE